METKPGIYTTEFWSTVFLQILGIVQLAGATGIHVNNKYVALGMAIIQGLYSLGRGQAKSGLPYTPQPGESPVTGKK